MEEARETIAEILDADLAPPRRDRLIFTSGGTEANNLAVLGIARANVSPRPLGEGPGVRAGRIVISAAEHQSVIEPAEHLLEHGWRLDTLGLTPQGVVRVDQLPPLLGDCTDFCGNGAAAASNPGEGDSPIFADTKIGTVPENGTAPLDRARLVSVQLGNHETGVLQPVAELAAICNRAGVPLHTDAVQVVGKLPVSFRALDVAAMSISAHKFQGPPGIGALLLRDGVPLMPLLFGGHQQEGLRPGTESVALVIGMATALELWRKEQAEHARRLTATARSFRAGPPGCVAEHRRSRRRLSRADILVCQCWLYHRLCCWADRNVCPT